MRRPGMYHPQGPELGVRRQFLISALTLSLACARPRQRGPAPISSDSESTLVEIERRVGGRMGVFALETGTGRRLAYRADERFAMCSTFKWVLGAAILAGVDQGRLSLDDVVPYGPSELLEYAPMTRTNVAQGVMTVGALAQAAITVSDNTAANLLLARIGGPEGLTQFCRSQGDTITRLDRNEPALNTNTPGDTRDSTSPRAMVGLMDRVLCGDALSPGARSCLLGWLVACETGKDRLRAGLPQNWMVGDKTGTGARNAANDIAIAVPPGHAPILIAVYMSDGGSGLDALNAAHAEIGRSIARELSS
jgi:beta-lactamase class A